MMRLTLRQASVAMLSAAAVWSAFPNAACAQSSQTTPEPAAASVVQAENQDQAEVVVTAQKREQRLQDVPAAVSVLNTKSLASTNQSRLRDYFSSVPGFQVSPSPGGGNQQTLAIRVVSSGQFANPTVGIMIDEVPFGAVNYDFSPEIDPSDLQRIEVLRGPQGTLYGANTMGGLVKFVTVDPSTSGVNGRVEAGLSGVSHGDDVGYAFRGALNLPLSAALAVRVSGFTNKDPGYVDNPTTGETDVNDYVSSGGRVSTLWKPAADLLIKLSALYQRSRANGSSEEVRGFGLAQYQQNYILNTGQTTKTTQAYSAIIRAGLGPIDLTSVTGYTHYKTTATQDYTNIAPWGGLARSLFGAPGAPSSFRAAAKRLTQEVRAEFETGESLDWLVGAFYSDEKTPIFQKISAQSAAGTVLGDIINFDIPLKFREYAIFADPTLHLSDRFSVQFGGRHSWIKAEFEQVTQRGALLPATVVFPAIVKKSSVFTYLVTPQFRVNQDLMIYARVATGYRPGRSNSFNPDTTIPRAADADTTTNYELGVKGDLLANMLSFDLSVYLIDWKNIQITLVSANNGIAYTSNAARATSKGGEFSATLRPGAGFRFGGWISLNKAELTEGVVNAATFAPEGARLPFNARFTANISADKTFTITDELTANLGMTFGPVGSRLGTFIATPARSVYPAFDKFRSARRSELRDVGLECLRSQHRQHPRPAGRWTRQFPALGLRLHSAPERGRLAVQDVLTDMARSICTPLHQTSRTDAAINRRVPGAHGHNAGTSHDG